MAGQMLDFGKETVTPRMNWETAEELPVLADPVCKAIEDMVVIWSKEANNSQVKWGIGVES